MRWTDLKECCDYYNINYKSLCTYMQKNKISKEEALSHYYQYYKYNRFTYNHVTYDSFAACCMAYEIKPICVRRYAKRKHFLLRHALSSYLNYHNKRKINRHSPYLSITLHKCYPYYLFGISTFPNSAYHTTARRKFSITIV